MKIKVSLGIEYLQEIWVVHLWAFLKPFRGHGDGYDPYPPVHLSYSKIIFYKIH